MDVDKEVNRILDSELYKDMSKKAALLYPDYNNPNGTDIQKATEYVVEKVESLYPQNMSDEEFADFYESLFTATMDGML